MSVTVRPLCFSVGAEIIGVDIRKPIDDDSFEAIHAAFLKHAVIVFRGQPLTREQHIAFGQRFGEVNKNDEGRGGTPSGYPELTLVTHTPPSKEGAVNRSDYQGNHWHTDRSYVLNPPMASILRAVEIPDVGGDTLFASMKLAYDALSDGMKMLIEKLHAIHPEATRLRLGEKTMPPVAQPVARVHPETGQTVLYLTEKIKQFVGMTEEESKPLLQFLLKHATRPQFIYRHRWQKHDLIMWDNRCLMHYAVGDFDKAQARHMERAILRGTPSGYRLDAI